MRLGAQPAKLSPGSHAAECYGAEEISERHRHRYEVNNVYRSQFVANGLQITGTSPDDSLVEIVELPEHRWFVAVQYHPEFKSKPTAAQPLFQGFVEATIGYHTTKHDKTSSEPARPEPESPSPKSPLDIKP